MRLVTLPGVFRPISDTWLLADALDREGLPPGARVLDLCSGSGALAIRAARRAQATAVDVSLRAVATIRLNALLNGVKVRAVRGDLLDAVPGERFDAIVSNPPYVPAPSDDLPARGPARAWDAGRDGRALLDRICAAAPAHLASGGVLLVVHSSLLGYERTAERARGRRPGGRPGRPGARSARPADERPPRPSGGRGPARSGPARGGRARRPRAQASMRALNAPARQSE